MTSIVTPNLTRAKPRIKATNTELKDDHTHRNNENESARTRILIIISLLSTLLADFIPTAIISLLTFPTRKR